MGRRADQEGLPGDQLLRGRADRFLVASQAGAAEGDQLRGLPDPAGQPRQRRQYRPDRRDRAAGAVGPVCGRQPEVVFGGARADRSAGAETSLEPPTRSVAAQAAEFCCPGPDALVGAGLSPGQPLVVWGALGQAQDRSAGVAAGATGNLPTGY